MLGGVFLSQVLKRIHNDAVLEMNSTIFVSYLLFYIAESTPLHVSGILAIVALGLYMTNTGKTWISPQSEHTVHSIWSYVGFVAETAIFIISGVIMGERAALDNTIAAADYLKLLGIYVCLHVIRFVMILIFWPLLVKIGYGMNFKQVLLCSYAGLRGAVGLSLALMVALSDKIGRRVQDLVLLHVAGIALLTLLINATTTGALVKALGLARESNIRKNILMTIYKNIELNIDENINHLKQSHYFNLVDWETLKKGVQMHKLRTTLRRYSDLDIRDVPEDDHEHHEAIGKLQ